MFATGSHSAAQPHGFSATSRLPLWRNGAQVTTELAFDVTSPLDNSTLYSCSSCTPAEAIAAVDAAQAAFPAWRATSPAARRDILLRASDILKERYDAEWKWYAQHEMGTTDMATAIDLERAYQATRDIAGLIQTVQGSVPPLMHDGQRAMVLREPYGVCLALAPWNMPWMLGLRAVLSPIATGNTVVLKGSELSPGCFWAMAQVLHEAGLPDGVLNTIYARPEDAVPVTTALIADARVKKLNFTGSTATGSAIAATAGKYLKPVIMELGGKAPVIVCNDANIALAARAAATGAFLNSGQICMSSERLIVHSSVVDEFAAALKEAVPAIFGNKPFTLVRAGPAAKNIQLVRDAVAKGAINLLARDDDDDTASSRTPASMQPAILLNPPRDADVYYNESFGPSTAIYTVESDDEAVRIANDTDYGLVASVFSQDLGRAFGIARRIDAGAVHVNSMSIHDESVLPHGGWKKSGFGRFNGREGLEEWVQTKTVTWVD